MPTNFGYAGSPVGLMKIVNIVFGLVSLGCIAATFEEQEIRERYFFGAIVTCFVVSLVYFLVHLISQGVAYSFVNKTIDALYHFIGAMLLIVGASLFLQLIVTFNQKYCDDIPASLDPNPALCGGTYHTKISAGAFGLINGVFYLLTLALRLLDPNDDELDEGPPYRVPPKPIAK